MCDELKVGDVLKARGPIGKFVYLPESCKSDIVMVGAGSGVTPISIREYAHCLGKVNNNDLVVAYRSQKDLICWDTIAELKNIPGIRIITTLTREEAPDQVSAMVVQIRRCWIKLLTTTMRRRLS